jgi:uncharacterized protein involved in copper resistance
LEPTLYQRLPRFEAGLGIRHFHHDKPWSIPGQLCGLRGDETLSALACGAGFADTDTGLRLRYEFSRKFAPYLGVVYEGKFGHTANFARRAGESTGGVRFVAGLRVWF